MRSGAWLAALAWLFAPACGKQIPVGLEVDLYLHAEAATPGDLVLQAALRKSLEEDAVTQKSLIHVRVVYGTVFLGGRVREARVKDRADTIARELQVTITGQAPLSVREVRNDIRIEN